MHKAAFYKHPCVSSIVRASPSAKSAEVLGGAACSWPPGTFSCGVAGSDGTKEAWKAPVGKQAGT